MKHATIRLFILVGALILANATLHARYYDARTGRFLQVDPRAVKYPSLSPYAYVANNPLIAIDPNGKDIFLLTWGPQQDQVGHSAIAIQLRDTKGNLTGYVQVRELWPANPVGKSGQEAAEYRSQVIKQTDLTKFQSGEGRSADGILKVAGDQKQDQKVTTALNKAETNKTYDAERNSCSVYTKTGVEATGISGGNGATAKVTVLGVTVKEATNVNTPVSVQNAVANSGDSRVSAVKALPKNQQDPNIEIKAR